MKSDNKIVAAIIVGAFIVGIFYYLAEYNSQPDSQPSESGSVTEDYKLITKVIDGDTVIVEGGDAVRLLGIDADEKGYPCYDAAKQKLEELVLSKKVLLVSDVEDKDQYQRYLRYVFLGNDNINLKLVKEGFAVARFYPENTKYREEIIAAEKNAIENKVGCKWEKHEVLLATPAPTKAQQSSSWSKLAGDAVSACETRKYTGMEKIVEGKVADGYKSSKGTVFLNFGSPYPNQCFVAVIFSSDLSKFTRDPQNYYEGKVVRVKGMIKEYKGKPEIILNDASQIEVRS